MKVRFRTSAPWTVLFGASGSGKSTILRVVAGLERADQGRVALGSIDLGYPPQSGPFVLPSQVLFDTKERLWTPPHLRPIRTAPQQAWLHKRTVRDNVLWVARSKDRDELKDQVFSIFRLSDLTEKNVKELSGGQRQRVSVARAVLAAIAPANPPGVHLLLMDEPFAGMDAALRDALLPELKNFLREHRLAALSVTHDVGEAFLLGAEVVRIAEGQVVAQGPVAEVLAEERKRLLGLLG